MARYLATRGTSGGAPEPVVDPARMVLTAGTSEAYAHLLRLLGNPGDEVAVPTPSYPLLDPIARLEGIRARPYRLRYHDRWRIDLASLEAAVGPRTRAIVVIQPNNPTGSVLSPAEVLAVEELCLARKLSMISDEVFLDFGWPPRAPELPSLLAGRRAPTFVLGGLSKSCGLPQLKVAWIAIGGPDQSVAPLLHGLEWIADLFLSVGAWPQLVVPGLLDGRGPFQRAARARIEENLELLRRAGGSGGFHCLEGDGGWSAILRLDDGAGRSVGDPALRALERQDVLVHPGHFYDLTDRDLVVSLLTPSAALAEGMARLAMVA